MAKKMITEIFEDIQSDKSRVSDYLNNTTLKACFEFAYVPEKKWLLPEGNPPYKPASEPLGMTAANLLMTVRTWPNFSRSDIKPTKREELFINLLEGVHASEALLILAVKNGELIKLYPFATKKFAIANGFITKTIKVE
jgi:hypothetical protein